MANGTLITVYQGYEIRDAAQFDVAQFVSGIDLGVNIYHAGEFIGYEKNVAIAKSRIDAEVAKARKTTAPAVKDTTPAVKDTTPAEELTPEQRKARNFRNMGRCENNPDDLI